MIHELLDWLPTILFVTVAAAGIYLMWEGRD
jgi:hypothetical protein